MKNPCIFLLPLWTCFLFGCNFTNKDDDVLIRQLKENLSKIEIADSLFKERRYQDIVNEMRNLLKNRETPPNQKAEAYFQIARASFRQGKYSEAISSAKKALRTGSLSIQKQLELTSLLAAYFLYEKKMPETGVYKKLLEFGLSKRFDSYVWYGILSTLTKNGHFERSNYVCSQILNNSSSANLAREYAATFKIQNLLGLKRYEEVIKESKNVLQEYPNLSKDNYSVIQMCLGTAMIRLKRYQDAIEIFTYISNSETTKYYRITSLLAIGDCYLGLKKYDQAVKSFVLLEREATLISDVKSKEIAQRKIKEIKKLLKKNRKNLKSP